MDRRSANRLLAGAPLAVAGFARAQPSPRRRIAWLSGDHASPNSPFLANFRRGLADIGRVEGRDFVIDAWWGEGSAERLSTLVAPIVASRPDVIVASGGAALRPLVETRLPVPVVFAISGEPVMGKVIESFARPGLDRTGISFFALQLIPKRLEFLREAKPGIRKLGIVGWSRHAGEPAEVEAATAEAARLGWEHQYHPVEELRELDATFASLSRWRADAVLAFADVISAGDPWRFAAFAQRERAPCISAWATFAQQGNVMSYGPNLEQTYARLATYVDRIFKGARASELPVERPTSIELVINRTAARDLGLTLTPGLLARANLIID